MLEATVDSEKFIKFLEKSQTACPEEANVLPLLKNFHDSKTASWEEISSHHQLSFLLGSWEQRVYWWEVAEVTRRLLLSGVLVSFGPGSVIQGAISILICLTSIKAYSLWQPFREDDDDFLQVSGFLDRLKANTLKGAPPSPPPACHALAGAVAVAAVHGAIRRPPGPSRCL